MGQYAINKSRGFTFVCLKRWQTFEEPPRNAGSTICPCTEPGRWRERRSWSSEVLRPVFPNSRALSESHPKGYYSEDLSKHFISLFHPVLLDLTLS